MSVVFCEQRIEPVDASPPNRFESAQQQLGALDGIGITLNDALPSSRDASDKVGRFEHRDVLLNRRERHVIGVRELRNGGLRGERAAQDIAPRAIRKGLEDEIYIVI